MTEDRPYRIAVVAPSNTFDGETAARVEALAARLYPEGAVQLHFAAQTYSREGHFAGADAERAAAVVGMANDPRFDAIWFARGGYGSGRLIETVLPELTETARATAASPPSRTMSCGIGPWATCSKPLAYNAPSKAPPSL